MCTTTNLTEPKNLALKSPNEKDSLIQYAEELESATHVKLLLKIVRNALFRIQDQIYEETLKDKNTEG